MSEYVQVLIVLFFYKSLIIVAGLVIIYLGYCFLISLYEGAGDIPTRKTWQHWIQGITGAIFALFGAGILIYLMLWHGIDRDIGKAYNFTSGQNKLLKETEPVLEKVIEHKKDCNK